MVQARFSQPDALTDLEELMNEIFIRRADRVPTIPYATPYHSYGSLILTNI